MYPLLSSLHVRGSILFHSGCVKLKIADNMLVGVIIGSVCDA